MNNALNRGVLERFKDADPWVRRHVWGRLRSCPFDALLPFLPEQGKFLELGAGHGAFCHLARLAKPDLRVEGMDVAEDKVRAAKASAAGDEKLFFRGPGDPPPEPGWDALAVIDVLYLMTEEEKESLLDWCAALLKPGGRLLVKEVNTRPRLRYWWSFFQEWVAIRVVGWTQGSGLHFESAEDLAARLERRGFQVEVHDLSQGWVHPHMLLTARKA